MRSFHSSLANGADIALFLLLGLLVFPRELPGVAIPALLVTGLLLLVGRPLAVVLSLLPFGFTWREMTLVSWAGLRGAMPIVLATFPATAGVPAGETVFNLVFFVVVVSALVQGTTVAGLATRLGLSVERPAWQSIADAVELDDVDVDLIEIEVTQDLALVGARLGDYPPPDGMLVTTVIRDQKATIPLPDTVFSAGDFLIVAVNSGRDRVQEVTAWARGERTHRGEVAG